ncbi:hypothetical protein BDEG_27723 [Batrachochytrium dendrobatidis JEL423]|uniref:Uncharacterized protein n=1 Tax=Batrachochytrium dendrobatidis (strain JEL423) TaxID=403673 RepID=A0A177WYC1_BATDL|nr:hypothetical protein BDEG_27723 [Batrachochytrium dendrobatidis JEL423]
MNQYTNITVSVKSTSVVRWNDLSDCSDIFSNQPFKQDQGRFSVTLTRNSSLHYVMDGVETNYNAWDSLAALGTNGTVGSSPIFIKSKNDVGSNPTITGSYNYFKKTIQINGINVSTNHLKRPDQLDKLVYLV